MDRRQRGLWRKISVTRQHRHQEGSERWASDPASVQKLPAHLQNCYDQHRPLGWAQHQETFESFEGVCAHTVSTPVQVNIPIISAISGGDLSTTYKAVQLHMHWGKDGGPGSEHTIDGEQYPMEVKDHHIYV